MKTTPKFLHIGYKILDIGDSSMFSNKVKSMLQNNALFIDTCWFKTLIRNLINSPGTCLQIYTLVCIQMWCVTLDTCNILLSFILFKHLWCRAVEQNCKIKPSTPNFYHSAKWVGGHPSQGALFHHHCADLEQFWEKKMLAWSELHIVNELWS